MRINPWKLTTLALLAGLVTANVIAPAVADRQPHMRTALTTMLKGKSQLAAASADKGGHRVKAISLLDQAIDEVEQGIKFDNHH